MFKLDENLGRSARDELAGGGHEVATVPEQSLGSATDGVLVEACRAEARALVTLGSGFREPDGVVAEQGTHDALVAKNGVYAELYRIQTGGAAAARH